MIRWQHWNPFNYLAGRIFLWFWLVLLLTVSLTLVISAQLRDETDIRRLPPPVVQQIRQQISEQLVNTNNSQQLLAKLQQMQPDRWIVVQTDNQQILNPSALPRQFDQHWLTELTQLNRPRLLRHRNTYLAGPFLLTLNNEPLALYHKRQRPNQPWWRLTSLSEPLLFLLLLAISAAASLLLALSISRPLRELLQQNLQFAAGKLHSRVTKLAKRQDELGQLGQSFNTMAERISTLMENQQRLLRDVSHELRSPLARAQLALGLAERQQDWQQLPRLKQELERLEQLLEELLTFSKLDAGQYQLQLAPCDLVALMQEVLDVNQLEADAKQQQLQLHSPAELWLTADSRLLGRAIENILRNAIKFSPAHSNISCQLQQQGKAILLQISDQGPGLAADQLDAIFEPFYRVSQSRDIQSGGTGLGLAIVSKIIRQHGGQVSARLPEQGGLCIECLLPATEGQPS